MTDFDWIYRTAELDELVDELCRDRGLCTRHRISSRAHLSSALALVQIATPNASPWSIPSRSTSPACQRLRDRARLRHARGSQDLEILELEPATVPKRMFDTQIAALFCGYRTSSLGKLVEGFLGLQLDKSAQLTDWTRRPLPEADLRYAASDVAHLLELRDTLIAALDERGRLAWAEEEIERLRSKDRSPPDPETLWWKLRGKTKLNGKARGVAQELARGATRVATDAEPTRSNRAVGHGAAGARPAPCTQCRATARRSATSTLGASSTPTSCSLRFERGIAAAEERRPPSSEEARKPAERRRRDRPVPSVARAARRRGRSRHHRARHPRRRDQPGPRPGLSLAPTVGATCSSGASSRSIIDGTAALRVKGTELELLDRAHSDPRYIDGVAIAKDGRVVLIVASIIVIGAGIKLAAPLLVPVSSPRSSPS